MLRNETTVIDQLFLELAQFTKARTPREKLLLIAMRRIGDECRYFPLNGYQNLGAYVDRMLRNYDDGTIPVAGEVS